MNIKKKIIKKKSVATAERTTQFCCRHTHSTEKKNIYNN